MNNAVFGINLTGRTLMAVKQVSITEAQLIQWFGAQVQSLENKGLSVENLTLSFNKTDGYSILLQETDLSTPEE